MKRVTDLRDAYPGTHRTTMTAIVLSVVLPALSGCQPKEERGGATFTAPSRNAAISVPSPVRFTDIAAKAGLKFKHNSGAFGLKLYPETMGSGVAFIDYDGDGYPDIFLANGRDWTPAEVKSYKEGPGQMAHAAYGFSLASPPPYSRTHAALYHNNRDGTFTDVTAGSGLDVEMQGMGVTVGDYDNDGKPDLFLTGYGRTCLFHNEGHGKFADVTKAAGVEDTGFSTSAMWVDYDRDGKLDLFVCRYIEWSPATDIWNYGSPTKVNGGYLKTYVGPPGYDGQASRLFHNQGGGRFADVSAKSGIYTPMPHLAAVSTAESQRRIAQRKGYALAANITMKEEMAQRTTPAKHEGKSMGVALCDVNGDGWPDLLVTNDTVRNYLYVNNKNGTFTEVGLRSGISYGPAGNARAGMGVDVGDVDTSGHDSVVIGNFENEHLGFYQTEGDGAFAENAQIAGIAGSSTRFLTFGCLFLDVNNDGWLDILTANGHVQDTIHGMRRDLEYAERSLLYLNRGQRPAKFDEIGLESGAAMQTPRVARGIACADIDLDGSVDIMVTVNDSFPALLHNDLVPGEQRNNALRVTLVGTKSNRSAIGALVEAHLLSQEQSPALVVRRIVRSGSSYLSQSELPLTVGLGQHTRVDDLTIRWPSGKVMHLRDVASNQAITVNEDQGIVAHQPLKGH